MNCPVCPKVRLESAPLEENLQSLHCSGCGGRWIKAYQYWRWLERHGPNLPEKSPVAAEDPPVADTGPGKLCPDCGRFLRRQQVGHGLSFAIDRCTTCGGIWLDRNEWDALKARNLHDDIHFIFSSAWQGRVEAEHRQAEHERLLRARLGDADYERVSQFKSWLDAHPRRNMLLACLGLPGAAPGSES